MTSQHEEDKEGVTPARRHMSLAKAKLRDEEDNKAAAQTAGRQASMTEWVVRRRERGWGTVTRVGVHESALAAQRTELWRVASLMNPGDPRPHYDAMVKQVHRVRTRRRGPMDSVRRRLMAGNRTVRRVARAMDIQQERRDAVVRARRDEGQPGGAGRAGRGGGGSSSNEEDI